MNLLIPIIINVISKIEVKIVMNSYTRKRQIKVREGNIVTRNALPRLLQDTAP